MSKYHFDSDISVDEYQSCCGLDIMHGFPFDTCESEDPCNKHDDYHCGTCDPIITTKDIIPMIKEALTPNLAMTAVTNTEQLKAAEALLACGFKVMSKFKGNHGSNLTLWLRQRPVLRKPRKRS